METYAKRNEIFVLSGIIQLTCATNTYMTEILACFMESITPRLSSTSLKCSNARTCNMKVANVDLLHYFKKSYDFASLRSPFNETMPNIYCITANVRNAFVLHLTSYTFNTLVLIVRQFIKFTRAV